MFIMAKHVSKKLKKSPARLSLEREKMSNNLAKSSTEKDKTSNIPTKSNVEKDMASNITTKSFDRNVTSNIITRSTEKKGMASNIQKKPSISKVKAATNQTKSSVSKDKPSVIPTKPSVSKDTTSNISPNISPKPSIDKDNIVDYLNLCANFESHVAQYRNSWKVTLEEMLIFYKIDVSHLPTIVVSIKIDKNLKVEAFTKHGKVKGKQLKSLLNSHLVLETWSQLRSLLQHFENENKVSQISIKHNLIQSLKYLRDCQNLQSSEKDSICLKAKLEFILSQVDALLHNRYSPNMLFLAYTIYLKSSTCYKYIQSLEFLILPKEEDLIKYITDANMTVADEKMSTT